MHQPAVDAPEHGEDKTEEKGQKNFDFYFVTRRYRELSEEAKEDAVPAP
jgi:hypothetical protein